MALADTCETYALPVMSPLCVFAAGRKSFQVVSRYPFANSSQFRTMLVEYIPLLEQGWKERDIEAIFLGAKNGKQYWRVTNSAATQAPQPSVADSVPARDGIRETVCTAAFSGGDNHSRRGPQC